MHDQADQLRALVRKAMHCDARLVSQAPRKIVVCGGKGGVGCTTIAVNLAIGLARQGARTVLVDADMNRADVAKLCHLETRDTLADVLSGRRTVHEVLHPGPAGVQVLVGAWSGRNVPDCSPRAQERLIRELDCLGRHADVVVLDVGSGLNQVVRRFWHSADCVLLVTTSDKIAIMDAYAAIKMLCADRGELHVHTLVNRADGSTAADVHARIDQACRRFLNRMVAPAGHIVEDARIVDAASAGRPFILDGAGAEAAGQIETLADYLLAQARAQEGAQQPEEQTAITAAAI
jgi:flagellar biosynthesis protein FlhG